MDGELSYGRVPPDRFMDVIQHLRNSFFADEPLNKSLSLCQPGEPHPELDSYSLNVLQQNMSTMATIGPNQEVVGASLLGCPANDKSKREFQDPKYKKVITFIESIGDEVDLGEGITSADVVDLKIMSVDNRMRGRGVGSELYRLSEQVSREQGFKVMRGEATALFSQKILEKNGWETLKVIKYSEYPSPENPLFNVEPPHEMFKVMIKRLD